jgi:hypothetical protein
MLLVNSTQSTTHSIFADNTIYEMSTSGIHVVSGNVSLPTYDVSIVDNVIYNETTVLTRGVYFQEYSGGSVTDVRLRDNNIGGTVTTRYVYSGSFADADIRLQDFHDNRIDVDAGIYAEDVVIEADKWLYFGDPNTNGTWAVGRSGTLLGDFLRTGGVWVTKETTAP